MRIECFLDTNVLLYAASTRIDDPHKYEIALRLVAATYFGLSGQVLAEFMANLKMENMEFAFHQAWGQQMLLLSY